jgi:hypothetical protein
MIQQQQQQQQRQQQQHRPPKALLVHHPRISQAASNKHQVVAFSPGGCWQCHLSTKERGTLNMVRVS